MNDIPLRLVWSAVAGMLYLAQLTVKSVEFDPNNYNQTVEAEANQESRAESPSGPNLSSTGQSRGFTWWPISGEAIYKSHLPLEILKVLVLVFLSYLGYYLSNKWKKLRAQSVDIKVKIENEVKTSVTDDKRSDANDEAYVKWLEKQNQILMEERDRNQMFSEQKTEEFVYSHQEGPFVEVDAPNRPIPRQR